MAAKKKSAQANKLLNFEVPRKTIRVCVPAEIVQQMDVLVKLGWFASRDHIAERALVKFVHSNRPELLEQAIWEDVEWGLVSNEAPGGFVFDEGVSVGRIAGRKSGASFIAPAASAAVSLPPARKPGRRTADN